MTPRRATARRKCAFRGVNQELYSYMAIALVYLLVLVAIDTEAAEENLYKILGVSSTATKQQIKQAYRRKALDTHPDKNKDVPPEEAARAFQKVVHAFETLSDDSSRRYYDQTGRAGSAESTNNNQRNGGSGGGGGAQWSWSFNWSSGSGGSGGNSYYQRRQPFRLKDQFKVKEAQSRILHLVSIEQLETVMVNDNDGRTLDRNLLICFLTPPLEQHVMDEMVYPWPFAAMSSQGIWWEDLLQTTVVRFHRSNSLTDFFDIPPGDQLKAPVFVFGKRGKEFSDKTHWTRLEGARDREVFDKWMWDQLSVDVVFVNKHDHPVERKLGSQKERCIERTVAVLVGENVFSAVIE
jgi:curved DNA-binding protein CbpA